MICTYFLFILFYFHFFASQKIISSPLKKKKKKDAGSATWWNLQYDLLLWELPEDLSYRLTYHLETLTHLHRPLACW